MALPLTLVVFSGLPGSGKSSVARELGRGVVLDSVAWTNALREEWRMMAARHRARYRPIEVIVPDRELHRSRVTKRPAKNDWPRVEASFKLYEAWSSDRLVLDASQPLDTLLAAALAYVRSEEM